jgi:beta-lactamase class A
MLGITMKNLLIMVLLSSFAWSSELHRELEMLAARHRGKVALYAHNLKTGASVGIDADRPVKTASVIKLPIMVEAFAEVGAGKRSLNDKIVLRQQDKVPGSGVLTFLHSGLELTLEDAITLMTIVSDNTATNLVLDQIGVPAVNARLASLGLKNTYLYKRVYKPADQPMPPDQKQFGLGKTTAREMAAVMENIARCDLGVPQLCRRMVEILKNQQDRQMIPRLLETADTSETESAIADKIGELDACRSDVALIESQAGPIIISAFTYDNQDQRWTPDNEAYLLIARMAKAILDAWSPGGLKTGHR